MRPSRMGTVGIVAADTARFTVFALSLAGLELPPGSQFAMATSTDIVNGRNLLVKERLHGDWIWFMDDDHAFAPNIVMQLLSREVDVVAASCLMRQKPFFPTAKVDEETSLDPDDYDNTGCHEVWSIGTAGMLVRKRVFEQMAEAFPGDPFEHGEISEDYLFCARLRELGIPIHVDLDAALGHCTTTVIWPGVNAGGEHVVRFQTSDSFVVEVTPVQIEE